MKQNSNQSTLFVCLSFVLAIVSYHFIFWDFFPNRNAALGHDYAYFFPSFLSGYYWFKENGLFEVPWFTPAFCGGVPYLPNPQVMYYSVPQFLTFLIDPLSSVYLTFILFAAIGFIGFYRLSIDVFRLRPVIAVYGATLFMFNGFYAYRMIIGHLTYHAFMLIPFIAYLLLYQHSEKGKALYSTRNLLVSGLLIAYFIHSGAANFLVPTVLSIVGIWALSGISQGVSYTFWLKLFYALFLGFLLSFAKLISGILFLSSFPRDQYSLPGIEGVGNLLSIFFKSLFLNNFEPVDVANTGILFEQHAFEFGITIIPLVIIVMFLFKVGIRSFTKSESLMGNCEPSCMLAGFILILILILPFAINYYSPGWSLFLKKLPYIKSSSSLFRWVAIEIPLIILISSIFLKKFELKAERLKVIFLILSVIGINMVSDKEFYHSQSYKPGNILHAYKNAKTLQQAKPIDHIAVNIDTESGLVPLWRNDSMVLGGSQLFCYEPIFGYGLEEFPIEQLRPGATLESQGGVLNLKNPACYLYGAENSCQPGEHFTVEQMNSARTFLNYQPFDYKIPFIQKFSNIINQVVIALVIFVLCVLLVINLSKGLTKFY